MISNINYMEADPRVIKIINEFFKVRDLLIRKCGVLNDKLNESANNNINAIDLKKDLEKLYDEVNIEISKIEVKFDKIKYNLKSIPYENSSVPRQIMDQIYHAKLINIGYIGDDDYILCHSVKYYSYEDAFDELGYIQTLSFCPKVLISMMDTIKVKIK